MDRRQPDRILIGINFKKIIKRDISFSGDVSFFALCRCGDGLRLYAAGDLMHRMDSDDQHHHEPRLL